MALPADVTIDANSSPLRGTDYQRQINHLVDEVRTLRTGLAALAVQFNAVLVKLDTQATKLNADGGVTDANYAATYVSGNAAVDTAYATDATHVAAKLKK